MYATGQQPYLLDNAVKQWPVTLSDLYNELKLNNNREDDILKSLISTATFFAEQYTKKEFITKDFTTYRDVFGDIGEQPAFIGYPPLIPFVYLDSPIVIRKSPLVSITEIGYLVDGVYTVLDDSMYRIIKKSTYSQIIPTAGNSWPIADYAQQSITIKFKAGMGAPADVPDELKRAILQHCCDLYVNRGDITTGGSSGLPEFSRRVYYQYKIPNM